MTAPMMAVDPRRHGPGDRLRTLFRECEHAFLDARCGHAPPGRGIAVFLSMPSRERDRRITLSRRTSSSGTVSQAPQAAQAASSTSMLPRGARPGRATQREGIDRFGGSPVEAGTGKVDVRFLPQDRRVPARRPVSPCPPGTRPGTLGRGTHSDARSRGKNLSLPFRLIIQALLFFTVRFGGPR